MGISIEEIIIDRIDFYNHEITIDGVVGPVEIKPDCVEVDYRVKIGKGWLQGTLPEIPYKEYTKLSHDNLLEQIKMTLRGCPKCKGEGFLIEEDVEVLAVKECPVCVDTGIE